MAKKVMGKGLDSILGEDDVVQNFSLKEIKEENKNFKKIVLDKIDPNPDQPRKDFKEEALSDLIDSIKKSGVLQPILVEKKPLNRYLIIAGERRYRASVKAGLREIPAIIKDDLKKEEILELALIENIQRENLSPIEEALAYKQIMDTSSLSQEEVAQRVGKKRASVANSLRLLKLPKEIQNAVNNGEVSFGHAKILLSVETVSDQKKLFKTIISDQISVREAEKIAQSFTLGKEKKDSNKKKNKNVQNLTEIIDFQNKLMTYFGTKVLLKGDFKKGKMEIEYYSLDDLNRIYDLIIKEK